MRTMWGRLLRLPTGRSGCLLLCAVAAAAAPPYSKSVVQGGSTIELTLDRVEEVPQPGAPLMEGESVRVKFRISDSVSHSPITGASPAAWMDGNREGAATTPEQCTGKVRRFAEGGVFSRSAVDLTSFFVIVLNGDASLMVADPRLGYGDTRLLALVALDSPGEDWALTADNKHLFVSMPAANKIASIDTASWRVTFRAELPSPKSVALQPDGAYLWVGYEGGVAAVDTRDLKVAARIATGRGDHHIAISTDNTRAFVSNPGDGTVSVIDIRKLAKLKDVATGKGPGWIAYSNLAKAAYVANEGDGSIVGIDAATGDLRAKIATAEGLGQIRFAPGERFALAVNPLNDRVYVIDASSNRVVQQAKVEKGPNQIAFTSKLAYIRHKGSDAVLMIPIESLGSTGVDISAADFSGGRHPPGETAHPTPADGIVVAGGENAVLVANPGDKAIYFYMEGMAAPMGNLSSYGHEPRAVLTLDRSLRERSPGVYETVTKLPAAGSYDIAMLLSQPQAVSCFALTVAPDPALARFKLPKLDVESMIAPAAQADSPLRVAFRLRFGATHKPAQDLKDVLVLISGASWQRRVLATHQGDGVYAADFVVPSAGAYTVLMSAASAGLNFVQYGSVQVTGAK